MRKYYPYLQEQYVYNLNEEQNKRKFLSQLDNFVNQRQYIQITLLDWQENGLKEIQGILTGGSLSKDGASSTRQTGSLSCTVDAEAYNVDSLNMDFSLNKKIFIEIGIKNETNQYTDWPILWFPQGIFLITDFALNSSNTSAVNLNISIKDKMCLLNGEVGGLIPSSTRFDVMDTQLPTGEWTEQKVLLYNIILELVNHIGGEDINNIIIQDVPLRIKQVVKWTGKNPLYVNKQEVDQPFSNNSNGWTFTTNKIDGGSKYEAGEDVGYVYRDFVVNEELVAAAGTPITTILDQVRDMLGNYEYFYNEFGIFIFREIKNYLNITQAQIIEEEMNNPGRIRFNGGNFLLEGASENQYLIETTNEKTLYSFSDDSNITSITVTPQYQNIKNDYIIEGIRQGTSSDVKYTVRYHLAIDDKPQIVDYDSKGAYYGIFPNVVYYTDTRENDIKKINRLGVVKEVTKLPNVGNLDQIYYVNNEKQCYYWTGSMFKKLVLIKTENNKEIEYNVGEPITYYPRDWRTFLYLEGLTAEVNGLDSGYYFQELSAFWPQEYCLDPNNQHFFGEKNKIIRQGLTEGNFFLDFIDASSSSLGEYSVNAIGRRQDVVVNDKINCLFTPEIPNVIFLNKDNPANNWTENTSGYLTDEEIDIKYNEWKDNNDPDAGSLARETKMRYIQKAECLKNSQPWTQVSNEVFSNLAIGGYANSAYEAVRYELFCHTRYQKTISITSIPVFYLTPNSRVELNSKSTNTYGDFMVQNINFSFGPGATMSVVLNEVAERL